MPSYDKILERMTEKQAEKIQLKIKKIEAELAADKRRWGGFYDDSRGVRYLPTELYVKLQDWNGGLRYMRWFEKNFPDDIGFPDFLFEWTIILFKKGKLKEAEKKAFQTYFSNTYLFDTFFELPITEIRKYENSNLEELEFTKNFKYRHNQKDIEEFAEWLQVFTQSEIFINVSRKFIDLKLLLCYEDDREVRSEILEEERKLVKEVTS